MDIKQLLHNYDIAEEKMDLTIRAKLEGLDHTTKVTPQLLMQLHVPDSTINTMMGSQWWHIRGIGPSLGAKLWAEGMRSPQAKKWFDQLPIQSQMWIIHKPISRIPLGEVQSIVDHFMPADEKTWEIVGSFRRKKPFIGDIDILYWGENLDHLLAQLEKKHGSSWSVYARGPHKIGGMFHFDTKCVEIDIWLSSAADMPYMRLYTTGSKRWNVIMRQIAKRKGMKLNQYTLERNGKKIPAKSEEEIFAHLGIKYRSPTLRV